MKHSSLPPDVDQDWLRDYIAKRTVKLGDCLLWKGKFVNGYAGVIEVIGHPAPSTQSGTWTLWQIKRLVWVLANGPIPSDYIVCCTCFRKVCLAHLELRSIHRSTYHPIAPTKLAISDVQEIRGVAKIRPRKAVVKEYTKKFKVKPVTIERVIDGLSWRHV